MRCDRLRLSCRALERRHKGGYRRRQAAVGRKAICRPAIVSAVIDRTTLLNFNTVQRHIIGAVNCATDDPEDTVTAACSLIESACRSILIELKLELPPKKDIDGLVRAVQGSLGLSPGRTDLPTEIEADVRLVLGGLTAWRKESVPRAPMAATRTAGKKGSIALMPAFPVGHQRSRSLTLFFTETWEQQQHHALPLSVRLRIA
jgi:hypothetical protein